MLNRVLDEALADAGYVSLVHQPYADYVARAAVIALEDDDATLTQAARHAVNVYGHCLIREEDVPVCGGLCDDWSVFGRAMFPDGYARTEMG